MLRRKLAPMSYGFRVPASAEAVSRARRRVVAIVRSWGAPLDEEALGNLALLASEVITNAIRHTEAPCAVCVRWTGRRVRVEVTDADPIKPHAAYAGPADEDGRGLLLVSTLAADWGTKPDRAGKTVWFECSDIAGGAPLSSLVRTWVAPWRRQRATIFHFTKPGMSKDTRGSVTDSLARSASSSPSCLMAHPSRRPPPMPVWCGVDLRAAVFLALEGSRTA
ncbi:ATP-binding protein [Streptomyces sp. NPDC002187]|uniref:ATP-binding protein n=1 Tax=Streptomyces sp. NPDC002187 TaxID=3364637 RepID=UPI00368B656A